MCALLYTYVKIKRLHVFTQSLAICTGHFGYFFSSLSWGNKMANIGGSHEATDP